MAETITSIEQIYEQACQAARTVCASGPGRVLLQYLALTCNLGTTVFVPGDAYATIFNEGRRSVVLKIMEMGGLTCTEDIVACLKRETEQGQEQPQG